MTNNFKFKSLLSLLFLVIITGCSNTESASLAKRLATAITLSANQSDLEAGGNATFSVISDLSADVTAESVFYVNDIEIPSNNYTFSTAGTYNVKAVYQNLTSNVIQITVQAQFVNRVLVEEYSGTWCGNCPKILYGVQLLKQQTDKAVSVQVHLYSNDPFITTQGNALAADQNVSGVPTGKINRTINWNAPQFQNVSQVLNEIKPSSSVGLAINSALTAGNVNIDVLLGYANTALQTKLVVYIVEDNLCYSQANYSANLYGGFNPIPNFEYDGVLRSVVTSNAGETIVVTGNQVTKNYSLSLPVNVFNVNNTKVVAFLINATTNAVLNVREAKIGQSQVLETL